jgi:hypothetical protein
MLARAIGALTDIKKQKGIRVARDILDPPVRFAFVAEWPPLLAIERPGLKP